MKCDNRMKSWLILLLCVLMTAGLAVNGVMAASTAEATGACTNAQNEGIEYFVPISALSAQADRWRGDLVAEVLDRPGGSAAGTVTAMEIESVNSSPRYQCTDDINNNGEFSCNSFPVSSQISGVYLRFVPSVSEDTNIQFVVYPLGYSSAAEAKAAGALLLEANGVVKYPPYPCSRNYVMPKDFVASEGGALIYNTSDDCTDHKEVDFDETEGRFAMVNMIPTDKLVGDRFNISVSPEVDYEYEIDLYFTSDPASFDRSDSTTYYLVSYTYTPGSLPVIDASALNSLTNSDLPLTLMGGQVNNIAATKKDLWGHDDFPTNTDFDIKFWYENLEGTLGYNNGIFHFERRLNLQFAPYCTEDTSKAIINGVATTVYDPCGPTRQPFNASLVGENTSPTKAKGVIVPRNESACSGSPSCTDISAVKVLNSEPAKATTYRFITRKCADATCSSVKSTAAYPYSLTVADGSNLSRTYRNNGNIYHSPGTRTEFNMKAFGNFSSSPTHPFEITGVRLMAEEPGTYVIYGFVPESDWKKNVPTKYAVKFYVTVNDTDDLASCYTLANNGYFVANWNDCLDYRQTQLMTFEHKENTEEAWIRNTSGHGVHFPYVAEWSYVPQQLEVASLTCRFEALSAAGRPGDGYCRPNDVYVPPYTKVTITGGTLYLGSMPEHDEYRVAYARQDTYNITHLFFSIYVKECDNVKKIPDTGVTLRTLKNFSAAVDAATEYVFTGNSLRIPAIGLGMETPVPIVHVYYLDGAENLQWDLSTLGNYVGELEGGSYIPYGGNSVLTGHFSPFSKAMVFTNLESVNLEDEIIVYANDGVKYVYKVVQKFQTDPSDVYEMFQQVGERSITLVTCDKYNSNLDEYERRLIIRAVIDHQELYEEGIW